MEVEIISALSNIENCDAKNIARLIFQYADLNILFHPEVKLLTINYDTIQYFYLHDYINGVYYVLKIPFKHITLEDAIKTATSYKKGRYIILETYESFNVIIRSYCVFHIEKEYTCPDTFKKIVLEKLSYCDKKSKIEMATNSYQILSHYITLNNEVLFYGKDYNNSKLELIADVIL